MIITINDLLHKVLIVVHPGQGRIPLFFYQTIDKIAPFQHLFAVLSDFFIFFRTTTSHEKNFS